MEITVTENTLETSRHTTGYLAAGPTDGPLLIFVHGWPELSLSWRHQISTFAGLGFRVVAPDMRGYGRSATYRLGCGLWSGSNRCRHDRATRSPWSAIVLYGSATIGEVQSCGTCRKPPP